MMITQCAQLTVHMCVLWHTQEWAYRQAISNLLTQVGMARTNFTAVRNSYAGVVAAGASTSAYVHALTTEFHARIEVPCAVPVCVCANTRGRIRMWPFPVLRYDVGDEA